MLWPVDFDNVVFHISSWQRVSKKWKAQRIKRMSKWCITLYGSRTWQNVILLLNETQSMCLRACELAQKHTHMHENQHKSRRMQLTASIPLRVALQTETHSVLSATNQSQHQQIRSSARPAHKGNRAHQCYLSEDTIQTVLWTRLMTSGSDTYINLRVSHFTYTIFSCFPGSTWRFITCRCHLCGLAKRVLSLCI